MSRLRRPGRAAAPLLLPAEGDAALPRAVVWLATLGLAVLCLCTLPAVGAHQRLVREHARLRQATQEAERRVERLRRELGELGELGESGRPDYLRAKATRALLDRGATYLRDRDLALGRRVPALAQTAPGRPSVR
jgi:hypothetical protein